MSSWIFMKINLCTSVSCRAINMYFVISKTVSQRNNERLEKSKPESRSFETSQDLALRRPSALWIEALVRIFTDIINVPTNLILAPSYLYIQDICIHHNTICICRSDLWACWDFPVDLMRFYVDLLFDFWSAFQQNGRKRFSISDTGEFVLYNCDIKPSIILQNNHENKFPEIPLHSIVSYISCIVLKGVSWGAYKISLLNTTRWITLMFDLLYPEVYFFKRYWPRLGYAQVITSKIAYGML